MNSSLQNTSFTGYVSRNKAYIYVVLIAISMGIIITTGKVLLAAVIFAPIFLHVCINKPFLFPFGLYVLLIPFDSILSVTGYAEGATLTKLLGVLAMLVFLLKGSYDKKFQTPDSAALWWFLFVALGVSSLLWAIDPARVISVIPTVVGLFLLYFIVASYKSNRDEFFTLKWCVLLGGCFSSFLVIFNYLQGLQFSEEAMRSSMAMGARHADPNQFAFSLIIPFAVCMQMMMSHKKKMMKALFCGIVCIILFGILTTGSRGAFLGVSIVFIIYLLFLKQRGTLIVALVIIGVVLTSILPDIFMNRWGDAVESGGAGRVAIWGVGINALEEYWLRGAGLNNFQNAYNEFMNTTTSLFSKSNRAPHNIALGYTVELGIVGITFMIMAMVSHYRLLRARFARSLNDNVMLKASLVATIVSSMFLDTLMLKSFWLLWMLIMINKNVMKTEEHRNASLLLVVQSSNELKERNCIQDKTSYW